MKLKHIIISMLFATTAAFTACTDEAAINPGGNPGNPTEVPEGMSALKLTFTAPGKTKSYADIPLTGTELENRIDSISIFLFDTNKDDTLVNVYTVPNPAANADTVVLVAEKSTAVKLVAIANPADSLVSHDWLPYINVIDLADFEKLTTLQHDSMPRPSFIMTAYNKGGNPVDLSGTTAASAEFELTRLVARVDILNRDSVGLMHTFELQRARMVNIPSQAYLLPDQVTKIGAPVTSKKLTGLDWVAIDKSDNSAGKMESQLYMYPAGNGTDDSGVSLEIEGLYNGTEARYSIPFENRAILPNHRYIVTLDSINPVTVIASIKMVDWETDTVSFNPDNGSAPVVTMGTLPTGLTNVTGSTGIDTIRFDGFQTAVIPFSVESPIVEPVFSTDAGWITVTKETSSKSYADVVFKKSYEITVAQNPDMARKALIHFVNPAKPTERVTYCITQTISDIPLAKFAKGNLREVGSDNWIELTAYNASTASKEVYGATFQWGRNVAFPSTLEATPDTTSTTIASDNTSETRFITKNPWHTESYASSDTWTKIATTTKTKDVCPAGWHVPTKAELQTIVNSSWINSTASFTEGRYLIIGDYVVRWKWIAATSGYMEVKMFSATANNITADNVMHADWDNETVVTRYFPATGDRYDGNGGAAYPKTTGNYWNANADGWSTGSRLRFTASSVGVGLVNRPTGHSVRCIQD